MTANDDTRPTANNAGGALALEESESKVAGTEVEPSDQLSGGSNLEPAIYPSDGQ